MSLDLIQIIENDDHILLSKLIENGTNLNTKIIYDKINNKCINCDKCKYKCWCELNMKECKVDCDNVCALLCNECVIMRNNCKYEDNEEYDYFNIILFVKLLFKNNLTKSIGVLLDSDFDFTPYHPLRKKWIITPLHYLFKNNDIKHFEKLAKKNILLNTCYIENEKDHDNDFICDIMGYHWCDEKDIDCNCDFNIAKYIKILFKNGLSEELFTVYLSYSYFNPLWYSIIYEYYLCANVFLKNKMNINNIVESKNSHIKKHLLTQIILQDNKLTYDIFKTNRIINFFIFNGLNIKNNSHNKETLKYVNIVIMKIKTTFMICISHKTAKYTISDFFKTNPGLYRFIGNKLLNYII